MDMNVLGFLLSLTNLASLGGPEHQLKDISLKVETVSNLKDTLNYPGISIEKFKESGYQRTANVGVYASEILRDYLFKGNVSPDAEGFVLWLYYEPRTDSDEIVGPNEHFYYLISRPGLTDKAAKAFLQYVNDHHHRRKRSYRSKK